MRTTLTLDEDVDRLLRELSRERGTRFRTLVNEALRAGLAQLAGPRGKPRRPVYRIAPVSLGRPMLPSLDNVAEVLAVAEGEDHS